MKRNHKKQLFAALGALFGILYFVSNGQSIPLTEFLMGGILALAAVMLVMSFLPEEALDKIRAWKRRG